MCYAAGYKSYIQCLLRRLDPAGVSTTGLYEKCRMLHGSVRRAILLRSQIDSDLDPENIFNFGAGILSHQETRMGAVIPDLSSKKKPLKCP